MRALDLKMDVNDFQPRISERYRYSKIILGEKNRLE